jgi:hypothetical protein
MLLRRFCPSWESNPEFSIFQLISLVKKHKHYALSGVEEYCQVLQFAFIHFGDTDQIVTLCMQLCSRKKKLGIAMPRV